MDISSFIKSITNPEISRSILGQDILKLGDELTGKILGFKSDGRTLVDFGKFRTLAEVNFPVSKSQVINVRVIEIGEQVKLSLIDPETKKSDITFSRI
jgi:predicted RNA-binding protein with RPS1 domain